MNVEECAGLAGLRFDCDRPARAFVPYGFRLQHLSDFLRSNCLPLAGLAVALMPYVVGAIA